MGSRGAFSIEAMVGGWASERRWFAPGVFPNVSRTGNWADVGHYTQMIWPATTPRRLRARVDRAYRLSGLPLCERGEYRRPPGWNALIAERLAAVCR